MGRHLATLLLVGVAFAITACQASDADSDAYWRAVRSAAQSADVRRPLAIDLGNTFCDELEEPVFDELDFSRAERETEVQSSSLASAREGGATEDDLQFISSSLRAAFDHLCPS